MSFYSSGQVQTKYIDPKSFVDGTRAVFEIDGKHSAFLPNMRLLDIGIFGHADAKYNDLIGAHAIIKDVTLYDGSTVLSQCVHYQNFRGFQAQNVDNVSAQSKEAFKACNRVGYQKLNADGLYQNVVRTIKTSVLRPDSRGAVVELREILPMLNKVTHLPSKVFANLRLEVNFNTELGEQPLDAINRTLTGQLIPILAVDVLDDKEIVGKMTSAMGNQIVWLENEVDLVAFPAGVANANVEQTVNFKLDGFKNKHVERLFQSKELVDKLKYLNGNNVRGFGRYQSVALTNEKIQYRINGANILSGSGAESNMERLAHVVDLYGDCFAYAGSAQTDIDTGIVAGVDATDGRDRIGNLSYNAIYIGQKVLDLQVTHSRTNLIDTTLKRPDSDPLNVYYFGEVRKMLMIDNSGYRIQYV